MAKVDVLAVSSGGGHWVQLLRLSPAFEGLNVAYVSRYPDAAADIPGMPFYTIPDTSRANKRALLGVTLRAFALLIRLRPSVIVTTGAAPGLILMALGKTFFRSKTIWIDSIANVEKLSSSGDYARRFADIHLTQWPDLSDNSTEFWGAVL